MRLLPCSRRGSGGRGLWRLAGRFHFRGLVAERISQSIEDAGTSVLERTFLPLFIKILLGHNVPLQYAFCLGNSSPKIGGVGFDFDTEDLWRLRVRNLPNDTDSPADIPVALSDVGKDRNSGASSDDQRNHQKKKWRRGFQFDAASNVSRLNGIDVLPGDA